MMHKTAHRWLNMTIYSMENYLQMPGKKKSLKNQVPVILLHCVFI